MAEHRVRPHPEVILTELADGTGVLLHLQTKFFFTLNESGVTIWKSLSGGATVAALCEKLGRDYEVDPGTAERDVRQLLGELATERLVLQDE